MNNGEWLRSLSDEGLANLLAPNSMCGMCAYPYEHCGSDIGECKDGFLEWLQAEHEEPDTWERIVEDAKKDTYVYWKCSGIDCEDCPSLIGGVIPSEYYEGMVGSCAVAKDRDLVRRCKELAGKERGE